MAFTCKGGMETIAQSRIIKFVVGAERAEFNVHEASIVNLSGVIDDILSSEPRELPDPTFVWDTIDVSTFSLFLEYAYSGDFAVNDPAVKREPGSEGPPSLGESMISWGARRHETRYALRHFGEVLRQPFYEEDAGPASTLAGTAQAVGERVSHSREYYLTHARLYLFAYEANMAGLKRLCVDKMRQSLVRNPGEVELVHAVADVLRYLWPETAWRDEMRSLVLRFVLTDMSWMMKQPTFIDLLTDCPEISHELLLTIPMAYWDAL